MYHTVKPGDSLAAIAAKYGVTLNNLLAENPRLKANPDAIFPGQAISIPGDFPTAPATEPGTAAATTEAGPAVGGRDQSLDKNAFTVPFGQLTFDAEGMEEEGPYFSRVLHVPTATSGATIGRGYDMKERSEAGIIEDLTHAGVRLAKATKFAQLRGLQGKKAKEKIKQLGLRDEKISAKQQRLLFMITYQELEGDVERICTKADVVAKYGACQWAALHPAIRDVVVDLRYRGDYTPATRERVQPLLVVNDLNQLAKLMADKDYWVNSRGMPQDRFKRRKAYIAKATV
ncbi:LysM peptidoglycan-binding domain-containing protein [Halioxenophilus sp. WMMB6]|uniref:LysM peptidoglycan-binding domain-containing protein n=1 Tax=Halioxenophilus sp. WMMB6 TaxID=3073815 RepID=UPI00295E4178|nr:LysM peptidoglycan-binding domain-containing protein [Halioxenophilus sp. WMMB6]